MRNVFKCKKVASTILAITIVLCSGTTVFAADNNVTNSVKNVQAISEIDKAVEVPSFINDNPTAMSIDDVLKHSTITVREATSMEGTYESDTYNAGLAGYTYQISFDWVAGTNSSGDYIFSQITNANITTYKNYFIIGNTWGYSSYDISENTYSISSSKKSVTFTTTYDFEYMMLNDPLARIYNLSETHTKIIVLNNLI